MVHAKIQNYLCFLNQRKNQGSMEKALSLTIDDAKIIDKLMEDHNSFTSSMQSRLTNLQVNTVYSLSMN